MQYSPSAHPSVQKCLIAGCYSLPQPSFAHCAHMHTVVHRSTHSYSLNVVDLLYVKRCTTTAFCSLACSTVSESGSSREGKVVCSTKGRESGRELRLATSVGLHLWGFPVYSPCDECAKISNSVIEVDASNETAKLARSFPVGSPGPIAEAKLDVRRGLAGVDLDLGCRRGS